MFYNGVLLPGLPAKWDREKYPYAIIYTDTASNKECLFVAKVPSTLYDNYGDGSYTFSADSWGGIAPMKFENDGTNWVEGAFYPTHIDASTYIWSNYDIIDNKGLAGEVGSVYRYGSDPVPAFSYNGTVLPKLPEWDRVAYPYAMIDNFWGYAFYVFPPNADYFKGYSWCFGFNEYKEGEVGLYWNLIETEEGIQWEFGGSGANLPIDDNLVWANFDVLNEDTSVYLSATDPIPVYE